MREAAQGAPVDAVSAIDHRRLDGRGGALSISRVGADGTVG